MIFLGWKIENNVEKFLFFILVISASIQLQRSRVKNYLTHDIYFYKDEKLSEGTLSNVKTVLSFFLKVIIYIIRIQIPLSQKFQNHEL
jgi:hypothetical protein